MGKIRLHSEYRYFLFAIADEIAWSKAHKGVSAESDDFEKGFIKGLEQAQRLIHATKKKINETNAAKPAKTFSPETRKRMSESAKAGWEIRKAKR